MHTFNTVNEIFQELDKRQKKLNIEFTKTNPSAKASENVGLQLSETTPKTKYLVRSSPGSKKHIEITLHRSNAIKRSERHR